MMLLGALSLKIQFYCNLLTNRISPPVLVVKIKNIYIIEIYSIHIVFVLFVSSMYVEKQKNNVNPYTHIVNNMEITLVSYTKLNLVFKLLYYSSIIRLFRILRHTRNVYLYIICIYHMKQSILTYHLTLVVRIEKNSLLYNHDRSTYRLVTEQPTLSYIFRMPPQFRVDAEKNVVVPRNLDR